MEGGDEGSSSVGDQEGASSGARLLELERSSLKGSRGQDSFAPWSRHTDSRNHLENGCRSSQEYPKQNEMSVASPACEESSLATGGCRTGRGPNTSTQIYTQGLSVKVCVHLSGHSYGLHTYPLTSED